MLGSTAGSGREAAGGTVHGGQSWPEVAPRAPCSAVWTGTVSGTHLRPPTARRLCPSWGGPCCGPILPGRSGSVTLDFTAHFAATCRKEVLGAPGLALRVCGAVCAPAISGTGPSGWSLEGAREAQCVLHRVAGAAWCSLDTSPGHRVRPSPGAAPSPGHGRQTPFTGRGAGGTSDVLPKALPAPRPSAHVDSGGNGTHMSLSPSKCDLQPLEDAGHLSGAPSLPLVRPSPPRQEVKRGAQPSSSSEQTWGRAS